MVDRDRMLHAEALIEEAHRLQNEGRTDEAAAYLAEAERLCVEEDAELDALDVPRLVA